MKNTFDKLCFEEDRLISTIFLSLSTIQLYFFWIYCGFPFSLSPGVDVAKTLNEHYLIGKGLYLKL